MSAAPELRGRLREAFKNTRARRLIWAESSSAVSVCDTSSRTRRLFIHNSFVVLGEAHSAADRILFHLCSEADLLCRDVHIYSIHRRRAAAVLQARIHYRLACGDCHVQTMVEDKKRVASTRGSFHTCSHSVRVCAPGAPKTAAF